MPAEKDYGFPAHQIPDKNPMGFRDVFPTETRGDGKLRPNNQRTGAAQGKGGWKKKVRCQQCGFLVNLNSVDYSGGSLDGAGAGGTITKSADVGTLNNSEYTTDSGLPDESGDGGTAYGPLHYVGEQALKKGAGCPFCLSKNSTKVRNLTQAPTPRPKVGF